MCNDSPMYRFADVSITPLLTANELLLPSNHPQCQKTPLVWLHFYHASDFANMLFAAYLTGCPYKWFYLGLSFLLFSSPEFDFAITHLIPCHTLMWLWFYGLHVRGAIFPQLQNNPSLWPGPAGYYNELIIYESMYIAGLCPKNILWVLLDLSWSSSQTKRTLNSQLISRKPQGPWGYTKGTPWCCLIPI